MSLGPRAQTHSFTHSHVAIWRLPSEICMASLKCIERTNSCSKTLAICQKTTSDNDKLILEHFVVISGGKIRHNCTDRSRMKLYYLLHQHCWSMQHRRCTKQARCRFSLLFVNQHFQALNDGTGYMNTYICLQLLPVAKRLQKMFFSANCKSIKSSLACSSLYSCACLIK